MVKFSDLGLNSWIVRQLDAVGIKEPTDIQKNCIPEILNGKNCIGAAKTGSGKTLAFALPILQRLSEDPFGIFAVVLTPTRELAFQIADNFSVIGKAINLRQCIAVGGMDMVEQRGELTKQPHVVVSTPGRLSDLLNSCDEISLKKIKFLVLDEADRLLGGSFDEQISTIFSRVPKSKQILLFSATITDTLEKVKDVGKGNLFQWEQQMLTATVDELEQYYVLCAQYVKYGYLAEIVRAFLENHENSSVIVFTNTCKNCQLLSMTLNKVGYENVALHGMISQKERLTALSQFKSNLIRILIATDVASRGLDIPEVDLVVNHDVPNLPKNYIHRVGRTARAGKHGRAVTLVTPSDLVFLKNIEEEIKTKLKSYPVDSKGVTKILVEITTTKIESEIKLDLSSFYEKKEINKRKKLILEGADPGDNLDFGVKLRSKKFKRK